MTVRNSTAARSRTARRSGASRRRSIDWHDAVHAGPRLLAARRSRAGSSAGAPTCATTPSTGISPRAATRPRSSTSPPRRTGARRYTYRELHAEVNRVRGDAARRSASARGDRVLIYMPMIPEAVFAMLACARIGAIHSVVFGGFAAASLATRIDDARPKVDGHRRRRHARRQGRSRTSTSSTRRCRLAKHPPATVLIVDRGLDRGDGAHARAATSTTPTLRAQHLDAQRAVRVARVERAVVHPLHVRHHRQAQGRAARHRRLRGRARGVDARHLLRRRPARRCSPPATSAGSSATRTSSTAPLINGSTTIMYEGLPIRPDPAIWWKIVAEHGVKTMFSSPTAIRVLKKQDPAFMKQHDISSLQLPVPRRRAARRADRALGEPMRSACAIVDNYWQTETGWPILSAQPGVEDTPRKFGSPVVPGRTATTCGCCDEATGAEVGHGREGRAGDRAAAAAGLHDHGVGRRRALREDVLHDVPGQLRLLDVRLGDARRGRLLLRARPHRRRDQRRGPSPRHARDRGGGAGARGHRGGRGGRRRRSGEGPGAGRVRGASRTRRASPRPKARAAHAQGSDGHRRPRARRDRAAGAACTS